MRRTSFVVLLVVGALMIPLGVYASHQFNDVPDSHTFHNAIDWMKDNNITVGCNPPANTNYCPDDNVTRGQMSAFMKRLAENNVVDAATLDGKDSTEFLAVTSAQSFDWFDGTGNIALSTTGTPIVQTTINVPVAGHLLVMGNASVGNSAANTLFTLWIQLDSGTCTANASGVPSTSVPGATNYATMAGAGEDTGLGVTGLASVAAGDHTVTLCGQNTAGGGQSFNATVAAQFLGEASVSLATLSGEGGSGGPQG